MAEMQARGCGGQMTGEPLEIPLLDRRANKLEAFPFWKLSTCMKSGKRSR